MNHPVSVCTVEIDKCSKLELPPGTIELVIKHLPAVVT